MQTINEKKEEVKMEEIDVVTCSHCGSHEECEKITAGDEIAYLCDICNDDLNG